MQPLIGKNQHTMSWRLVTRRVPSMTTNWTNCNEHTMRVLSTVVLSALVVDGFQFAPLSASSKTVARSVSPSLQFDFFGGGKKKKEWTEEETRRANNFLYGDVDAEYEDAAPSSPSWSFGGGSSSPAEEEYEYEYEDEKPAFEFPNPFASLFQPKEEEEEEVEYYAEEEYEPPSLPNPFAGFKNPFEAAPQEEEEYDYYDEPEEEEYEAPSLPNPFAGFRNPFENQSFGGQEEEEEEEYYEEDEPAPPSNPFGFLDGIKLPKSPFDNSGGGGPLQ